MAGEVSRIIGIEDVCKMLREAPKIIVATGFLKALNAGAQEINRELNIREPVREGKLKAARMMEITLDNQLRGGLARIGYGKMGQRALWVEYGHRMIGHKPGKKAEGMIAPHPFMRVAFDSSAERAIAAFADSLAQTVREQFPQGSTSMVIP